MTAHPGPMPALAGQLARARAERLEAEALVLLAAGHTIDGLIIVTSPLYPDGVVMTRDREAAHREGLRAAVTRWVDMP